MQPVYTASVHNNWVGGEFGTDMDNNKRAESPGMEHSHNSTKAWMFGLRGRRSMM